MRGDGSKNNIKFKSGYNSKRKRLLKQNKTVAGSLPTPALCCWARSRGHPLGCVGHLWRPTLSQALGTQVTRHSPYPLSR